MKKVKKIALALVCVLLVGALCGCGAKFDASGYLSALLDASYKGDSAALVDMKLGTAEEAAALYEEGIDSEMEAFLGGGTISSELESEFRDIFKDMLGKVKYTVGEAEKQSDDSYVVTVTYEQMLIFDPVMSEYVDAVTALAEEWTANPDAAPASQDEMMEMMFIPLRDSMKSNLANVQYAEPATATVRIELENNVYSPNSQDLEKLEEILFDTDAAAKYQ